ncbi:MAG: ion transporter [Candidatus Thiodiazotropha sp. (ex Monitilora ramsayi)]|nr:ion transporter [Candidatus Thiodiazotropha sp. (ex Monitilora ramsayi)]
MVTAFLVGLITLNVLAVILDSVEGIYRAYKPWFDTFEVFSVAVFTIEYVLRLWACTSLPAYRHPVSGRFRFALTPLALVDLFAILPSLLTWGGIDLRALRVVRLARIARIAKLGHYSKALQLMASVVRRKRHELAISLILMFVMLILASSLMYVVENEHQPEAFSSIPATMWWAVATLTTVGYGDVTPVTGIGKLLGAFIAIFGIGLFALPAGIIAAGFIEEKEDDSNTYPSHCPHCGKAIDKDRTHP